MQKVFAVYFMSNKKHGTIYTGVTSDLRGRVWQHRNHVFEGSFTDRYSLELLVWYEWHSSAESAIRREKQLKDWKRGWKVELIEERNPRWDDLWDEIANG
jgi:putative endonuclease